MYLLIKTKVLILPMISRKVILKKTMFILEQSEA